MNEFVKKLIDYIDLPPDDSREIKKLFGDNYSTAKLFYEDLQRQCENHKKPGLASSPKMMMYDPKKGNP